jgi:hypothetical protein
MTQETENAPKIKMDLEISTLEYNLTYHKSAIFTKYICTNTHITAN